MGLFVTLKCTTTGATPQSYYFKGRSDVYTGAVATKTGVSVAPTAEQNRPETKVEELVAKGILIRLAATTGTVGGTTTRKHVKLVCLRDKIATALDDLESESIRGSSVLSVRVPQKASFY
jgi:hypothetical protein